MAERPAYWAVIPASVRYDQDLPPNAKLLYGEITALSNAKGYCSARNAYFADLFGLGEKSVSRLIAILANAPAGGDRGPEPSGGKAVRLPQDHH